jgi:tellurite methyltransferase
VNDRQRWESRYNNADLVYGEEPSDFLAENEELLPRRGLALDVAAGEGRNAAFLAGRGLQVIALDISIRALARCRRRATTLAASVEAAVTDLNEFQVPADWFDLIINFNYLQRDLTPALVKGLRPGGMVVFETLTKEHLRWKPDFNPDYLLETGELLRLFSRLQTVKYRELTITLNGSKRSVASIMARKPAP